MAVIKSSASTDSLIVDPTSKAARVTLYDTTGTVLDYLQGTTLTTNSSAVALGVSGVFTGTGVDVSKHASITASVKSDVAGTLYMEFSSDNSNWDSSLSFVVAAGVNESHTLSVSKRYFRCRYVNGSTIQGYMRLQSLAGSQIAPITTLNTVITNDNEAIVTRPTDIRLDISRNLVGNMKSVNKFGRNTDIDVGTEDIWGVGGTWVQPTTAGTVTIVSSSALDTAAGTGARTLFVEGLNGAYEETSETITLLGATPVSTANSYFIVNRMTVLTAGTGGTNAGTITSTSTGGGTPTMLSITIGKARSQFCIYQVPLGYTGYLERYQGGMNGGAMIDLELFTKPFGGVYNLKGTLLLNLTGNSYAVREYETPLVLTEKTLVKITGTASANNTDVVASFDIILVAN